jgi:hypothetical protein
VLNFKKNNLHEHVKQRGSAARTSKTGPPLQESPGSTAQPKQAGTVQPKPGVTVQR